MTDEISRKPAAVVRTFNRRAAMGAGLAAAIAVLAGATTNSATAETIKKAGTVYKKKTGTTYVKKTGTKYQKALPKNDKNLPK